MEPPNKGHFKASHVVLCSEVVLFSEVVFILWERYFKSVLYREVVPFLEGPLSEVPLYWLRLRTTVLMGYGVVLIQHHGLGVRTEALGSSDCRQPFQTPEI